MEQLLLYQLSINTEWFICRCTINDAGITENGSHR